MSSSSSYKGICFAYTILDNKSYYNICVDGSYILTVIYIQYCHDNITIFAYHSKN